MIIAHATSRRLGEFMLEPSWQTETSVAQSAGARAPMLNEFRGRRDERPTRRALSPGETVRALAQEFINFSLQSGSITSFVFRPTRPGLAGPRMTAAAPITFETFRNI